MSWQKLSPQQSSRPCGVTLRIAPMKSGDKPSLQIRIARDLAVQVRLSRANDGRADIFLGEGADAGMMRVEPNRVGEFRCRPGTKAGGVLLVTMRPPGSPQELKVTPVIEKAEGGGLTFALPWHRPAADRVVEEEIPPLPPKSTPATLDAIEEDARPWDSKANQQAANKIIQELEERSDKPVNGSAKAHVYADSEASGMKLEFTYNGKSCRLSKKQHVIVSMLHAAMRKDPGSLLDYDTLIKASDVTNRPVLQANVANVRPLIRPLGLGINAIEKTGYRMVEEG